MKKKVLITGGSGLLGKALIETSSDDYILYATYFPNKPEETSLDVEFINLNITSKIDIFNLCNQIKPDIIIHTAAIGNVDFCEKNKDISWQTNVEGTRYLVEVAQQLSARFIYVSSNAVFDGENPPYAEEDEINPLSYYGETKVVCERLVKKSGLKYTIIRAILMYGWHNKCERNNMLTWVIDSLSKGQELKIVNDIYSNPLLSIQCAQAIWNSVILDKTGSYNVAGKDCISRYDFAVEIAKYFNLNSSLITPVPNSYFSGIASRPSNTCFCVDKMEKELQVKALTVTEALKILKDSYDKK